METPALSRTIAAALLGVCILSRCALGLDAAPATGAASRAELPQVHPTPITATSPAPAAATAPRTFRHPVGRVWAAILTTSGPGVRGLSPWWERPGADGHDWAREFAGVEKQCIRPFGPARGARVVTGSDQSSVSQTSAGYDEIMIYRPWGIEDHADRAMHFDALPRARVRLEALERNGVTATTAPTVRALRRVTDTDAFIDGARTAQDHFGKPFWYYFGACIDPTLKAKTMSELQAWALQAAEPVLIVGGNIVIDSAGIADASSTDWALAQSLLRLGVRRVGYEPAAHTLQTTNNAAIAGGSTQFTPWALDPHLVGFCTSGLWENRLEWRPPPPTGLSADDLARNARAWMVPLDQTAGEVVLLEFRPQMTRQWLVERLAEGYSVMVNPSWMLENNLSPQDLRGAAESRRAELTGAGAGHP